MNTDPEITFNVGRVSGGGALNIVPDLAIGRVNVRVRNAAQQTEAEGKLRSAIEKLISEQDGISVAMHGHFTSPPKTTDASTEQLMDRIVSCGATLGQTIKFSGSGGASDGNKFARCGLPNIDSLGPEGGEIHSSNEFLKIDSLVPKTKLSTLVLMSLASQ
jgi:glutamate carboxypeptidase